MQTKENFRKKQKNMLNKRAKTSFTRNFIVFKELMKIIKQHRAKNILLYLPLPFELDLNRFRNKFAKKCKIFVPFMQDKSLKMVKLRTPFYKKRFGIYEPANSFFVAKIDMAIIPVIGVDRDLKRIGQGFGFYDRFFQNLSYKPLLVFVSPTKALSKEKLGQRHDIQADFYINPYEKFYRKELKDAYNATNRICRHYHRRWDRIFSCQKDK